MDHCNPPDADRHLNFAKPMECGSFAFARRDVGRQQILVPRLIAIPLKKRAASHLTPKRIARLVGQREADLAHLTLCSASFFAVTANALLLGRTGRPRSGPGYRAM